MPYPASTQTLQAWVQQVDKQAVVLKNAAEQQHAFAAAGQLSMDLVVRFYDLMKQSHNVFTVAAGVTGIPQFLKDQKEDQSLDPVAEFNAMKAQLEASIDWLNANTPQDTFAGGTYKLGFVFPADYTTPASPLVFTAAQTATYRLVLADLIATIG